MRPTAQQITRIINKRQYALVHAREGWKAVCKLVRKHYPKNAPYIRKVLKTTPKPILATQFYVVSKALAAAMQGGKKSKNGAMYGVFNSAGAAAQHVNEFKRGLYAVIVEQ